MALRIAQHCCTTIPGRGNRCATLFPMDDARREPSPTLKSRFSYHLGDFIYGANDGLITTFAVVSSIAGAGLSVTAIIVVGIASLFADGFSMGASRYLSLRSEQTLSEGAPDTNRSPFMDGFATFGAFVIIGAVPLVPFIFIGSTHVFLISAVATGVTLFLVGAARSLVTTRGAFISGTEMLVVGGFAAAIAYGLGAFVKALVGTAI